MDVINIGREAVKAKYEIHKVDTAKKNETLVYIAKQLIANTSDILQENAKDIALAQERNMASGLVDRLRLTEDRICGMAEGLIQIAELPDPVGEMVDSFDRPNGLHLEKVRVPMGVVGIIYESRPNVTSDAFGLCFKASNAVVLKGGSDAIHSNRKIVEVLRKGLEDMGLNPNILQFIDSTDREDTLRFIQMRDYIDVLIPRGGAGLIRFTVENSKIPVIETGTGNCHVYVDEEADLSMATDIVVNAKTQRIGVCNACESLLVHEKIAEKFLPKLKEKLDNFAVEVRGDERVNALYEGSIPATEEDYGKEYLDYILSMKVVSGVEEAVAHINQYNTGHSETIVTQSAKAAEYFLQNVDAACVYHNASTRFTDGFEFGFGAEIGISTQKLHARGPMGLRELTSYKYKITGNGQVRS